MDLIRVIAVLILAALIIMPASAMVVPDYDNLSYAQVSNLSWQDVSDSISAAEPNDTRLVQRIYVVVLIHMSDTGVGTRAEVYAPDLAWKTKEGDCSERALLIQAMLERSGRVRSRVIHGYVRDGINQYHDTVEFLQPNGVWKTVNSGSIPSFRRYGLGLCSGDRIVNI